MGPPLMPDQWARPAGPASPLEAYPAGCRIFTPILRPGQRESLGKRIAEQSLEASLLCAGIAGINRKKRRARTAGWQAAPDACPRGTHLGGWALPEGAVFEGAVRGI